jgi:hypothetical protein
MLVCNVSLRPPQTAIAADIAEATVADDSLGTGNVVFATIVDDPASVSETIDAWLGEIMLEAASATDTLSAPAAYAADIIELGAAADSPSAAAPILTSFAIFDGTPSASVTVTNGGLTVTHGSTSNGTGVFSTKQLTSGKFYFEVLLQTTTTNANAGGIKVYASGTFSDPGGTFSTGAGVSFGSTQSFIWSNAVSTGKNLGTFAVGDRLCAAIDLTSRLGWFRKNGGLWNADAAADPATGTNGVVVPSGSQAPLVRFTNGPATDAFTANFGASSFAFTPPAGFSLGWGT